MCVLVPEWFLLTLISSMPPAFFNSFNIYCHVAHLIPYFFLHFLCHLQLPMSAEKSVTSEVTSFTYLPIFACIIFEFHFSCSSLFHFIILFFFFLWFPWFCLLVHFFNICNMTFFFFLSLLPVSPALVWPLSPNCGSLAAKQFPPSGMNVTYALETTRVS